MELRTRVAGLILLLYGQPLSRICALRNEDVTSDHEGLWLRIGEQKVPIPLTFAEVVQACLSSERPNTRLYNKASPFLFPGQKVGDSISVPRMHGVLKEAGIEILPSRNKALLEHVKTCPAPIVAEMLGSSHFLHFLHFVGRGGCFLPSYQRCRDGTSPPSCPLRRCPRHLTFEYAVVQRW